MKGVAKSAAVVGAMTAISRVGGLVREQLLAYFFGTTLLKSAFDVAFRIPNLFRRLFGEGALSAAFIPVYTESLSRDGAKEANAFAARVCGMLVAVLGMVVVVSIAATYPLESAVLKYRGPDSRWLTILPLTRIMLPYALFICAAALVMGVLNSLKSFAVSAFAPFFLNFCSIVALACICPFVHGNDVRIKIVAWAVVVSGLVQLGVQLPALARRGVPLRIAFNWKGDAKVRKMLLLMAPMIVGYGLTQLNVCLDSILAMWAAPWGPSALEYAERLVYLPLGLVGTAFGTVLLPVLSEFGVNDDAEGLGATLSRALDNILTIMVPLSFAMTVLALPIIELVYSFKGGAFNADSALRSARALGGYAPGLVLFCAYKAVVPAFYAFHDTRTPVVVGMWCVAMNFCLNVAFIVVLPAEWKHVGIAAATVVSSLVNSCILVAILRRRHGIRLKCLGGLLQSVPAAVATAAAGYLLNRWLVGVLSPICHVKLAQLVSLGAAGVVGVAVYVAAMRLLGSHAVSELASEFISRRSRKK